MVAHHIADIPGIVNVQMVQQTVVTMHRGWIILVVVRGPIAGGDGKLNAASNM